MPSTRNHDTIDRASSRKRLLHSMKSRKPIHLFFNSADFSLRRKY
jgi:hypothetical protein